MVKRIVSGTGRKVDVPDDTISIDNVDQCLLMLGLLKRFLGF